MKLTILTAVAVASLATAGFAESHAAAASGDAAAGEKIFKKCKACHMIVDTEGTVILKGGKTGPNLYGIAGHAAGSVEGYKYGADLVKAGEAGLVWDEEHFVAYVQNPKSFLGDYLDNPKARSKMSFRLKKGMEDVYAYLASVAE